MSHEETIPETAELVRRYQDYCEVCKMRLDFLKLKRAEGNRMREVVRAYKSSWESVKQQSMERRRLRDSIRQRVLMRYLLMEQEHADVEIEIERTLKELLHDVFAVQLELQLQGGDT